MAQPISVSAFERVYKTYYIRLYRYALGFINDADVCKDIVSEVFSKLWRDHAHIQTEGISGYLFVSVRNACMNHLRRLHRDDKLLEYCKVAMKEENMEYLETMEERIAEMNKVIAGMPDKTKQVIEACYLYGHTYEEVAISMGITIHGVKKHIVKAFALLRQHFKVKKRKFT